MKKHSFHRLLSNPSGGRLFAAGILAVFVLSFNAPSASAALKLGTTFSDNMVIQRDQEVTVWGEANPGSDVEIQLGDETSSSKADIDGRWKVALKPLPVGGPYTAHITGGAEAISLKNILSGDIWLCAGQSNMQLGVSEDAEADQMQAQARALTNIRLLRIPKSGVVTPNYLTAATWATANSPALEHFSAVAFHLGVALAADPKLAGVPIGLIDSSFGGTSAEGWIPRSALEKFSPEDFSPSMFNLAPSALYNGMIAPLGPLSLKGVVWYQGENNSAKSLLYPQIMGKLIPEWRRQFHNQQLPFIIVQLPPFVDLYAGYPFTWLREAQRIVATNTPDIGLVVSIDTTNGFNLHPREKGEIGRRAALQARRLAYKENVVADGPTLKSATPDGESMRVTFETDDGPLATRGGSKSVVGFALAGADHIFHFANASITADDTVTVHCADVPDPKFVRYAWGAVPECNLYNRSALPAGPFRTDDMAPNVPVEIKPVIASRCVATDLYNVVLSGNGDLASLGIDKRQFISNDLDGPGIANFPGFFGPRQLQSCTELTPESIRYSDVGVTCTYSFSATSMTVRIQNLAREAKDKVTFHLHLASGVHIAATGDGFELTRGQSHLLLTGADAAKEDSDGGGEASLSIDGNATRTLVFKFSTSK